MKNVQLRVVLSILTGSSKKSLLFLLNNRYFVSPHPQTRCSVSYAILKLSPQQTILNFILLALFSLILSTTSSFVGKFTYLTFSELKFMKSDDGILPFD